MFSDHTNAGGLHRKTWLLIQRSLGPKPVSPAYQPYVLGKEVTLTGSISLQAGDNNL